ncbi:MAG: MurR/RpiR family transcriptional regulator [Acidobacteria bacterium]|nr:MurR/RpiR family transcriptional regulator [Acidobacteriota bacterium]
MAARTKNKADAGVRKSARKPPRNGSPAGDDRSNGQTPLEARFLEAQTKLSRSRKQLLGQILAEAHETFFLSSREMGRRYSVDSATIVRTIQAMGYEKFADFVQDLRNHFVTQITPYAAMRAATQKHRSVADYVSLSLDKDLENLNALKAGFDVNKIIEVAAQIRTSRRIIVIGLDFAASLAISLAYGLVRLGHNAEAPVGTSGSIQNQLNMMTSKDLLVAISFGKCLRETVEAAKRAKRNGIPTLGLTDNDRTPIARICGRTVIASTARASFIDSYVAPMAAINAILVACAHSQPKRALKLLEKFDKESGSGERWYEEVEALRKNGR